MDNTFYYNLTQYLRDRDISNANKVIMSEMGNILVKDRENFVTLLRYADIPAMPEDSDAELIERFIKNIDTNRKLMIDKFLVLS